MDYELIDDAPEPVVGDLPPYQPLRPCADCPDPGLCRAEGECPRGEPSC